LSPTWNGPWKIDQGLMISWSTKQGQIISGFAKMVRSTQSYVLTISTKFGGDLVVDVMRTHPMIIIGGILQRNSFFVPPDEFLKELRERRGSG